MYRTMIVYDRKKIFFYFCLFLLHDNRGGALHTVSHARSRWYREPSWDRRLHAYFEKIKKNDDNGGWRNAAQAHPRQPPASYEESTPTAGAGDSERYWEKTVVVCVRHTSKTKRKTFLFLFFSFSFSVPMLTYGRIDKDGRKRGSREGVRWGDREIGREWMRRKRKIPKEGGK